MEVAVNVWVVGCPPREEALDNERPMEGNSAERPEVFVDWVEWPVVDEDRRVVVVGDRVVVEVVVTDCHQNQCESSQRSEYSTPWLQI